MNLNVIKLNPSQELRLKKACSDFFGKAEPLELDKESGLFRQKIKEGRAIFLEPLLCLLPEDFSEEEFRALKSLEIFPPQKAFVQNRSQAQEAAANNKALQAQDPRGKDRSQDLDAGGADKNNSQGQDSRALYYFPALVESGGRQYRAAIPCAFGFELAQNFDLQKIFAAAQSAAQNAVIVQKVSQDQNAAPQSDADKKKRGQDLVLAPTSFYFARAEVTQNTWSLYDALWKKLL